MMRVLMVYNDYKQPGGERVAFANECALLREHGHDVATYTRTNQETRGMHPLALTRSMIWNREAYDDVRLAIRRHYAEIVHVHNYHLLISPAVFYAAAAEGVPVVFTVHNYRLGCPAATLFRAGHICEDCLGQPLPWRGVARRCFRGSRRITAAVTASLALHRLIGTWDQYITRYIALTEFTRLKLIEAKLPPEKIVVKPNGLRHDPPYSWEPDRQEPFALVVGRLSESKGVQVLLDAWRRHRIELNLKIAGTGEMESELRRRAKGLDRVQFVGHQSREGVDDLLRRARMLLAPSLNYEGHPFNVLEAMAIGTPLLVAGHGSLSMMVTDGGTGLTAHPGAVDDWARAIRKVLADPEQARVRSRAARKEYERWAAPDVAYRRQLEIYLEALGRDPLTS